MIQKHLENCTISPEDTDSSWTLIFPYCFTVFNRNTWSLLLALSLPHRLELYKGFSEGQSIQWCNKKYIHILRISGLCVLNYNEFEHQYLRNNTYKGLLSTIFCEKPVMLQFKIKKVKTPQEVKQSNVDMTKKDSFEKMAQGTQLRAKLVQYVKAGLVCIICFLNNEMNSLTFWMRVSTILYWSGMWVTMCVMLSSDVLTRVGPNTIARFLGSI